MATESDLMAECMDETRRILISAGIIDQSAPPMFVAEAVIAAARVAAARIDALEVDAARYRWLRNDESENGPGAFACVRGNPAAWLFGEELDAAIDAAMADTARGEGGV